MITDKVTYFSPTALSCLSYIYVTGTVVLLIGSSLVGASGALNWGGGANGCQKFPTSGIFQQCPTMFAPRPLPWGSPEFIGIGILSFISIILTEMFGSLFLKNFSIIMGLAVGCIVAGANQNSACNHVPVVRRTLQGLSVRSEPGGCQGCTLLRLESFRLLFSQVSASPLFPTFFFLFSSGSKFGLLGPFPDDACLRVINVGFC